MFPFAFAAAETAIRRRRILLVRIGTLLPPAGAAANFREAVFDGVVLGLGLVFCFLSLYTVRKQAKQTKKQKITQSLIGEQRKSKRKLFVERLEEKEKRKKWLKKKSKETSNEMSKEKTFIDSFWLEMFDQIFLSEGDENRE